MKSKPIRLTGTSYAVLALLEQCGGEATSYDLKQALEVSVENFWPVPHTTAYEEPARLAAGGYLTARQEAGGRRKRVYSLTEAGRAALSAWAADSSLAPPQLREEAVLKLFAGADGGPLLESRAAWHEGKKAELERFLEALQEAEGWERSVRTLVVGITYHQKMLELLALMADFSDGTAVSARG